MKRDNRRNILFRYGIIVCGIMLGAMAIVNQLFDTTVVNASEWNAKALEELSRTTVITPERGNILAADGTILAANLRFYTVRLDYRSERFQSRLLVDSIQPIADSLARMFPQRSADEWKRRLLSPLKKEKKERPRAWPVITNINYAQLQDLKKLPFFNLRNPNKNGLTVEDYLKRVNPYGNMARRSIGRVGKTKECSDIHGISGLEKALDSLLYGVPGVAKKMPVTRDYINWTDVPARPGYDIVTTIDINMQDIVENELNRMLEFTDAEWGVALLMDVKTGDIKAISNLERSPFGPGYIEAMNRAVQGYEPGSVVKTLSMLIALEDGLVSGPNQYFPTGRSWAYAGGRPISDAHGVDGVTVAEVIERSSNIGMAKIITSKYNDHPGGFYHRLKQLGFLEPMHTGIYGEQTPHIDSVPSDRGGRIAMSRMSYGYATMIPPIYTLAVYNAIANGGRFVRPRLVSRLIGPDGVDSVLPVTYIRNRICSEVNAELLRSMLKRVVWGAHGTARRLKNDLVSISGKTGTCYMIDGGGYNTSKKRLAFCGFFPSDEPRYSCMVLTAAPRKNAFGAASTSGEVVKNIALKLYSRGMLGNSSDYRANDATSPRGKRTTPIYYAETGNLHSKLGIGGSHATLKSPASKAPQGRVPDVKGLPLPKALSMLEKAGYEVEVKGTGAVTAQTPAAGTRAPKGHTVTLSLSI